MLAKLFRLTTFAVVTLAAWDLASNSFTRSWAEEPAKPQAEAAAKPAKSAPAATLPANGPAASPGVFNYYVQPGVAGPLGAQLYVSPRPTPPLVGHTYVTYPPLAPHEFLYHHHRTYETYNPGSGWTRTRVRWH
jgi:hypothetical protein